MALRDELASGFEKAGRILSPTLRRDYELQQSRQKDTDKVILEQTIKGVQDGSIPPEQGNPIILKTLRNLGASDETINAVAGTPGPGGIVQDRPTAIPTDPMATTGGIVPPQTAQTFGLRTPSGVTQLPDMTIGGTSMPAVRGQEGRIATLPAMRGEDIEQEQLPDIRISSVRDNIGNTKLPANVSTNEAINLFGISDKVRKERQEAAQLDARAKAVSNRIGTLNIPEEDKLSFTERLASGGDPASIMKEARALVSSEEKFEPILDDAGNPVAQRSTKTGKVIADPRAPKSPIVQIINDAKAANKAVEEASKTYGSGVGERANERWTYAFSAAKQKTQLERIALAISKGAGTGEFEEGILKLKSIGKTFGLPVGDLSEQEVIRVVSNEMALRLRNPESGLGLTGNTSNRDLQFLKDSVVGLNRTREGNIMTIKMMNKFNDLTIDVANEQSRLIKENDGAVPVDIDQKLMEFVDSYEFFDKGERDKINNILGVSEEDFEGMSDDQIERLKELRRLQGG